MEQDEIDVAVAIIQNNEGLILVNERQQDKEHPGHWEFPGGKIEDGETATQALKRECEEELGIDVLHDEPLLELCHAYPNKTVRLHVRLVQKYMGEARSLEGQALAWLPLESLYIINLLAADKPILEALSAL